MSRASLTSPLRIVSSLFRKVYLCRKSTMPLGEDKNREKGKERERRGKGERERDENKAVRKRVINFSHVQSM